MDDQLPTFSPRHSLNANQTQSATASSLDDGSHLDELRMPDIEDGGLDPDAPIGLDENGRDIDTAPPEMLDKDAFWIVFSTAFNLPGQIMRDLKPLGIQPEEETGARAASDATHSLLEIYYPSALLPQSETLAHLLVAGPFFVGKVIIVSHIMRSLKAKPVNAPAANAQKEPSTQPKTETVFEDIFLEPQGAAS